MPWRETYAFFSLGKTASRWIKLFSLQALTLQLFLLHAACPLSADEGKQNTIAGTAPRPFPAMLSLEYSLSRGAAWLDALDKTASTLPESINARLRELKFPVAESRLGVCAAIYRVMLVTPQISTSPEIRVYLSAPSSLSTAIDNIMANPELLALKTLLVMETRAALKKMGSAWPRRIVDAQGKIVELEKMAAELDGLWEMENFSETASDLSPFQQMKLLEKIDSLAEKSPLVWFMLSKVALEAGLPQKALIAADNSLAYARPLQDAANNGLWQIFTATTYYIRARSHLSLDQPALANADFESGIRILRESGIKSGLLTRILLAHGELGRIRKNFAIMCRDFEEACALGACQPLAMARRESQCSVPGQ